MRNYNFQGTGVTREPQTGDWCLHIHGELICGWGGQTKPVESALLEAAFEAGKKARSAEIKKLL
jgi:hypothetical protein